MPRPSPPETIARIRFLMGEGRTYAETAAIMGMSRCAIAGACLRHKIESGYVPPPPRPIPDDFVESMARMNVMMAARHYKASKNTISRWVKEAGITPARFYPEPKPKAPKPIKVRVADYRPARPRGPRGGNSPMRAFSIPGREATRAASAQLFLQRYGPVIRAKTIDRLAANNLWIVHGRRVSEPEMLAMAERKGFAA